MTEMANFTPSRRIAPFVVVEDTDEGIVLRYDGDLHKIELDTEAVALLLQWLQKAGYSADDSDWPGIAP